MTLKEAVDKGRLELVRDHEQGFGITSEFNHAHNRLSRAKIRAMRRERGSCWIWTCNPYKKSRIVREYRSGMVYNFDGSFITPIYDAELERLMRDRLDAQYTTATADYARIDAIYTRADELGAVHLFWS